MKIQNELLTGVVSNPQELKKSGAAGKPETDFASMLADQVVSGQADPQILAGMIKSGNIADLSALTPVQAVAAFSPEEDKAMDEIADILDVAEEYGALLAGRNGSGEVNLKSAYNLLEGISSSLAELKKSFSGLENNPALAGIVNELEVMASTEKFKMNRGDYFA